MKKLVLSILAISFFATPSLAGDLSYRDRVEFEDSFRKSCEEAYIKADYGFEEWQIKEICKCSAMFTGEQITQKDIKAFFKTRRYPKSMLDKRDKASTRCVQELTEAWGYPQ